MRYLILTLLLVGCSDRDTGFTRINAPPAWLIERATAKCVDVKKEDIKTHVVFVEHNKFKCTGGFNQGERVCSGWKLILEVDCGNGVTVKDAYSFGNTEDPKKIKGEYEY